MFFKYCEKVKDSTVARVQGSECFSIEEKGVILQHFEAGESNVTLSMKFGVSHSAISTIKKNKPTIANDSKSKRVRKPVY